MFFGRMGSMTTTRHSKTAFTGKKFFLGKMFDYNTDTLMEVDLHKQHAQRALKTALDVPRLSGGRTPFDTR